MVYDASGFQEFHFLISRPLERDERNTGTWERECNIIVDCTHARGDVRTKRIVNFCLF